MSQENQKKKWAVEAIMERHLDGLFVGLSLSSHAVRTQKAAVVGRVHQDGVLREIQLVQGTHQSAQFVVDGTHVAMVALVVGPVVLVPD